MSRSGEFVSEKAYLYGWRIHAGYWQETSDPCHLDLSIGMLECPYNTAAGFSRANNLREQGEGLNVFC